MQELVDALRNAADEPPPSSIDLDRLITDEYRRTRVRAGVVTVLAAAALAAFVAVPLAVTTGGSTGPARSIFGAAANLCPYPEVSVPAHPSRVDLAALCNRVAPRLAAMLPGATLTDPATKAPGVQFTGDRLLGVKAVVRVDDAAGTGLLSFTYHPLVPVCSSGGDPCDRKPTCPDAGGVPRCEVRGDGTIVLVRETRMGTLQHNWLDVYRPDGSHLQLGSTNSDEPLGVVTDTMTVTATHAPLTSAQLIVIADAMHLDR